MTRKRSVFLTLTVALAALSLTAGAVTASAAELLDEAGPVPNGTELYLVSENMTKKNGSVSYPWTCDSVGVVGEVTANSGGTVTVASLGAGEAEGCEYVNPLGTYPVNIEPTLQAMSLSSSGSTMSLKFVETSKSFETCVSAGALAASPWNGGIEVSGLLKTISGCYGGSNSGVASGTFTVYSPNGLVEVVQ